MQRFAFFDGVNETLLSQITYSTQKYSKGTTIYPKGTPCNGICMVLSGELTAYSLSENGSESRVFSFQKDSIIGANLIFGDINIYPLTIYCASDCELLHIDKASICTLLHDYHFTLKFIENISFNSQAMNQKIAMFTQKTLRENILDYLNHLALKQKSTTVRLPISKKQLADYFGVQRPSLFRTFKHLKDEGIITIAHQSITLLKDI